MENAIAMSGIYHRAMAFNVKESHASKLEALDQETKERVALCAMSCPRILWQLQHLTDSSWLEEIEVPDMELFRVNNGNWNKFGENPVNFQINLFKLRKAMEVNGLLTHISRNEENPVQEDEHDVNCDIGFLYKKGIIEQCGFWGLPSFINHSCFPNAKCMVVGKAMFVMAVRGIAAEEEIIVPYSRSLYPLVERERNLTLLGFHCDCKRCVLEQSLSPSFAKLSNIINNYCSSLINPKNTSPMDMQTIAGYALQLENIDAQDEEKQLIRASFYCLYKFIFAAALVFTNFRVLSSSLPTIVDVTEAMQLVDPSSGTSMELLQMLLKGAQGKQRDVLLQKAMDNSIAMIGKQKEHVLRAFVLSKVNSTLQTVRTWNVREVYSAMYI